MCYCPCHLPGGPKPCTECDGVASALKLEERKILGHKDTGKAWRDREGDIWRFKEWIGWCWSREGTVSEEPGTPTYIDGPYTEVE